MAYTTQQLVDLYTNANLGKGPTAAQRLTIDSLATQTQPGGDKTDAEALTATLKLVDSTTAVAVSTYQFFTGAAPSAAGLGYLVNSTTNANDLNDQSGVYDKFSQENRFINFAINLGTGAGAGAAQFAADYPSTVTYAQVVASAYNKIIGNTAAAAAGVDVNAAVGFLSRQANIDFLRAYVVSNGVTGDANIQLAVKAALVGQILNVATVSGIGLYANATKALIVDLSDGTLSTDTPAGVNIITAYPAAGANGTTYTLKTGADTIVGTNANDTINALSINADGTAATTFSAFDSIDGGGGIDTLNIYTDAGLPNLNNAFATTISVKNVEVVNILNANGASPSANGLTNVANYQGIQELWQVAAASKVTGLANGVTAGFKNITAAAALAADTNATATSAKIALSNVAEASTITVDGSANKALAGVTLSGTVADTNGTGGVADTNLVFKVGKEVTAVTVSSSVGTTLTIDDSASATATKVHTVDLSGSTGAITFVGDQQVTTITGGSAGDKLTIDTTTNKASTGVAAVSALVNSGAGNDEIIVTTDGDGLTTVNTGAGDDKVTINSRSGTLVVDLGDGADSFTTAAGIDILAGDTIDAGAGIDTLALKLVGSSNVGAFKNFDVFDVVGMGTDLDLDILSTNNTVTEIVGSGVVTGTVTLSNIGAGVNYRATGDQATGTVALTQKTAGALTVTLDADQTGTDDATDDTATTTVSATGATSITAVFDTSYLNVAGAKGETAALDNLSKINLTTQAATSISVVSGGANAKNTLAITEGAGTDKLASVTITGASALTLTATGASKLASVDASGSTGGLTTALATVIDGGTIKLGSGVDTIAVTNASTKGGIEALQGFEKTLAVAVNSGTSDAKTAAIADADVLTFTGSVAADVTTGDTITKGVLKFAGAGPTTLDLAIDAADAAVTTTNDAVIFQYLNDSYLFVQSGGATDTVVKLTGITGVTNLVETTGGNTFFIV